jgi:molybdate transport system substrate-binding protein
LVSFFFREETNFDEQHVPNADLPPLQAPSAHRSRLSLAAVAALEASMIHWITGLSSMATRHILADLARDYELRHGVKVDIRPMGGVEAAKLARAGEPLDVVALASKVMENLEAEGHIARGSIRDFARSEIAIAVPAGSRRPGVESEKAVRQAMTEARRVCYSTGPSGDHFKALCERWGLTDSVLARALKAPPGVPVATLVAGGDADFGIQQLSELIGQPGIEVVGALPPEIQAVTVFSAGVSATSAKHEAAQALVAYLASAETQDAKRRHGMEPA